MKLAERTQALFEDSDIHDLVDEWMEGLLDEEEVRN